jgi:hypothetical protein
MIDSKVKEIREFCESNSDPEIIKKLLRYFKEGYDGYGIDKNVIEKQIEIWKEQWKDSCGRLIIQYSTEKMDNEYKKKFRKNK